MLRLAAIVSSALLLTAPAAAAAEQAYATSGSDVFQISNRDVRTETSYSGTQQLTIERSGGATRFTARVLYDRAADGISTRARGSFEATLLPSGELRDGNDADPDYLTILNQPFAVQLDPATLRDLRSLRGGIPFDFPSPMTGATLHGSLRRLPDALLSRTKVLGIAFAARGPLHGALPDRPGLTIAGTISMSGTAYYAYDTSLLLALDATLAIEGGLDERTGRDPVSIVYRRTLRPLPPGAKR